MAEELKEQITDGILGKLQPWQAMFMILSYMITQFELSEIHNLVAVGMIAATLGFAMVSNYKHKEEMKVIITPFLVDQVLKILKDYMPPLKVEPEPIPLLEPEVVYIEKIVEVPVDRFVEVEKIVYVPVTAAMNDTTGE